MKTGGFARPRSQFEMNCGEEYPKVLATSDCVRPISIRFFFRNEANCVLFFKQTPSRFAEMHSISGYGSVFDSVACIPET